MLFLKGIKWRDAFQRININLIKPFIILYRHRPSERGEGEGDCLYSFAGYAKFLSLGLGAFNSNVSPFAGNPQIDYYTCNRTQGYNFCPFPFEPYYDQWDKHQGGKIKSIIKTRSREYLLSVNGKKTK